MIYVLEVNGAPLRKAGASAYVYAYADIDTAKRAARNLGARVVEYRVAGSSSDVDAGRELVALRGERDALKRELEAERQTWSALRARYGADEDETPRQWIERLYGAYRRWHGLLSEARRAEERRAGDE